MSGSLDEKKKSITLAASNWKETLKKYQRPAFHRSLWQLLNTFIPYVLLWYLMLVSLRVSLWLTALLAVVAAGFLVRIFIIFHDCTHGSFFRSPRANAVLGFITGVLTFTPFQHWKWQHAVHHSSAGDLDRRGTGDIWTLTVREYLEASRWKRFAYRLARNPVILFLLAPMFLFLVHQRIPSPEAGPRERRSVHLTNLSILILGVLLGWAFGWKTYLLLQIGLIAAAGSAGLWLFYVQHQFEGVYWERREEWDFCTAALKGSSFYKLPKVLQWFSGNIGFHHIHHLSPSIPNYHLEECHRAEPLFQTVKPVTLVTSLKSLSFRLWDEQRRKLVSFREAYKSLRALQPHK
jgi:omega-6 fatty acid desaturase (delta-12 desaturase)